MTVPTDSIKTEARRVSQVIKGMPAADGAGELTRVIGQPALLMHDPFLLLVLFALTSQGITSIATKAIFACRPYYYFVN